MKRGTSSCLFRSNLNVALNLFVLLLLCKPSSALAYSRSCDSSNGICIWWPVREVTYYINEDCSDDVAIDDCIAAVRAAFEVWNEASCSDFRYVYGGTTPRRDAGFDQGNPEDNINLVIWHEDDWTSGDRSAPALSTGTYNSATGEMVDFDIELNGVDFIFTTAEPPNADTDIRSFLAHEAPQGRVPATWEAKKQRIVRLFDLLGRPYNFSSPYRCPWRRQPPMFCKPH